MPQRIHKILSSHGICSLREAERMILAGRVTINGKPATIGQSADAAVDHIEVDGRAIEAKASHIYIMLNKPRGYVTTMRDERGRKTVISLLDSLGTRVYPVGRLDMYTSGLLLLTNDGQFANTVAHPSHLIPKTYEVRVRGVVDQAVSVMRLPMEIDSGPVHAICVDVAKETDIGGTLMITISEGRNRQVRKMCEQAHLEVRSLKRVSIGALTLGSLKTGQWRHLTSEEQLSLSQWS